MFVLYLGVNKNIMARVAPAWNAARREYPAVLLQQDGRFATHQ